MKGERMQNKQRSEEKEEDEEEKRGRRASKGQQTCACSARQRRPSITYVCLSLSESVSE